MDNRAACPCKRQNGVLSAPQPRGVDNARGYTAVSAAQERNELDRPWFAVDNSGGPREATPQYSEMIPAIATDPGQAGRLAVAWPEAQGPDSSRIVLRYSSDGGEHWSDRLDVADDTTPTPNQHDHVTLSWLGDGRL